MKIEIQKGGICPVLLGVLLVVTSLLQVGCTPVVNATISTANSIDRSIYERNREKLIDEHIAWVRGLQEKGDPMGDYFWTRANERGWVKNSIKDEDMLRQMYVNAAIKGSVDAEMMVGLIDFKKASNNRLTKWSEEAEKANIAIWQEALKKIDLATQKRCWYYTTSMDPSIGIRSFAVRSVASDIYHNFEGTTAYPKNIGLMNYWKNKNDACQESAEYQEASQLAKWGKLK